jgi:hypothetical protein
MVVDVGVRRGNGATVVERRKMELVRQSKFF